MLKFGNKEFRNLQEQVKKNMDDILFILQEEGVLNEFGIKVIGQEASVADMPTVADYKENNPDWSYGDAYAIGTEDPYELYILTRANGTHPDDYWFNIGEFPQPGPQGPAGAEGEQGPQGEQGNPGVDGTSAGFGVVSATATTLEPGSSATVTVTASGPDSSKNFSFEFGIPRGEDGTTPTVTVDWGEIGGTLSDQTDLVTALQGKQNTLVSGTNIKTINNESLLGGGDITIDGKNNVLDLGSASSVTAEQLALLEADESLLIYATYGAYGKQLYVFRGEYTTGNLTYKSVPNKGSDHIEFLTLVINKSTRAITKSVDNLYGGVSKIEVNGATYTPTNGKVILPTYPSPSGNIDIDASATATSVSSTVPASASVTVDTSGDTPVLEFSFEIPQGEKGETGATGPEGPEGPQGEQGIQGIQGPQGPQGPTGATGPAGQDGQDGADGTDGQDGITPHIGDNGDWYIGDTDTGVHAQGVQGPEGPQGPTGATGPAGQDGLTTDIYVNGQTYTQVSGTITLPDYPTPSSPTVGDFVAGPGIVIDEDLGNNKVSIEVDQEYIPFKVDLATVATTGSYNDLTNKPTIPTVNNASLDIQVNGATIGTFSANASVNATANITVPTNVSDLNNDSGYITGITSGDVTTALGYTPLSTITSGDVTGALGYTPGTSNFSGSYDDLSNKPTIPTISASTSTVSGASDLGSIVVNGSTYNIPQGGGGGTVSIDNVTIEKNASNELRTHIGGYEVTGSGDVIQGTPNITMNVGLTSFFMNCLDSNVKYKDGKFTFGGTLSATLVWTDDVEDETMNLSLTQGSGTNYIPDDTTYVASLSMPLTYSGSHLIGAITLNAVPTKSKLKSITFSSTDYSYLGKVEGKYLDLSGASFAWNDITGKPSFATVATSGSYSDLINKPSLATVATSGNYVDLINTPSIPPTVTVNDISLSTPTVPLDNIKVGTSGYYNTIVEPETPTTTSDYSNKIEALSIRTNGSSKTYGIKTFNVINIDSDVNTTSGTLSTEDMNKIKRCPEKCIIRKYGSSAQYTQYYELTEISYTNTSQTTISKYVYELVQATTATAMRGRKIEITTSGGWTFTTTTLNPVMRVQVNGATYSPSSGVVTLPSVPTMASPISVTTETWTFTLDDDSTVTKTVVIGA